MPVLRSERMRSTVSISDRGLRIVPSTTVTVAIEGRGSWKVTRPMRSNCSMSAPRPSATRTAMVPLAMPPRPSETV